MVLLHQHDQVLDRRFGLWDIPAGLALATLI